MKASLIWINFDWADIQYLKLLDCLRILDTMLFVMKVGQSSKPNWLKNNRNFREIQGNVIVYEMRLGLMDRSQYKQ